MVVAIIALLIAILLPSLSKARDNAKILVCSTNQRTLMQAVILYSLDYKGHAPLQGSEPYTMIGGNGPYPSAPYWDARLVKYTGIETYRPTLFSCPTVLSERDKTTSKTARTYRMNLTVGGWDAATNSNKDQRALADFGSPDRTIVFTEDWSVWNYNTIWGWNTRWWYDVVVTHLWTEYTTTPWGLRPAEGGSNFAFVDGHVTFTRHIDGWPDRQVANYILDPKKDF